MAQQPNSDPGHIIIGVSTSDTIRHTHTKTHTHTHGRTPVNELSARRKGHYLHKTQQTQQMNSHAPAGFETAIPKIERRRPTAQTARSHGIGLLIITVTNLYYNNCDILFLFFRNPIIIVMSVCKLEDLTSLQPPSQ